MNEQHLIWGVGLIGAALLLIFMEIFIPSGGLIALVAAGTAIAGVWQLFLYDTLWGLIGILGVMVMAPVAITFGLKVLPSTPFGRKMFFGDTPPDADELRARQELELRESLQALVGAEGRAVTDLRPVGVVIIEGRRYDALAEGGYIGAGSSIRVTVVDGTQVKVRAV